VSRIAIWKIKKKFECFGADGLKDHRAGRLFEPLNSDFYDLVVGTWNRYRCGARKLYVILRKRGFSVSLRKISQVMVKERLQKPCLKRRRPRKYKRYEYPVPNIMWHTDWHKIKAKNLKGENIIVYLDDCSRKVMGYFVGGQTGRNSRLTLYFTIEKNQAIPFMLNSDRGTQFIANKRNSKGKADHKFQKTLSELGIIFIPSRRRHPQTNGKNEKFFDILDKEFDDRFETIHEFIEYYNNERLSEAVDYMTPNEAYKKRL